MDKNNIQLLINQLNNPLFDEIFKYATQLAEGISIGVIVLITLFIRFRWTIFIGVSLLYNTIVVQFLKRFVFDDVQRPKIFFEKLANWHVVEGINIHSLHSFPSGHTSTAFCIFFSLSIALKNKKAGLLLFFGSLMVGYSRMYLSQHYLRDVVAGSMIGVVASILAYLTLEKSSRLNSLTWIDKSLRKVLSK